jgi:lipoprotein-anchoring transpeptidase ErfK/SrfK
LAFLVVIVIAGGGAWLLFGRDSLPVPETPASQPGVVETIPRIGEADPPKIDDPVAVEAPPAAPTGTPEQRSKAQKLLAEGEAHRAGGRLIQARSKLSQALLTEHLGEPEADEARRELTALADKTVFSPRIYEGDPYAMPYTFREREVLQNVERRLKLYTPWQGLLKVNNLHSARRIRAGQTLKMIRGPFHAVVYKQQHVMDLYLHREGLERVFIRRLDVGLGKEGSTPLGAWRVENKLIHGDYYPTPDSSQVQRRIRYGQPGYAFGKKGLWIGLKGTDANTEGMSGYGIHSTDAPDSIGQDASEGCIRLSDQDIDLVYALLYEKMSTVEIR